MTDLTPETIREAVKVAAAYLSMPGVRKPLGTEGAEAIGRLLETSVAYADLLANAEQVWWCVHHGYAHCDPGWPLHSACGPRLLVNQETPTV